MAEAGIDLDGLRLRVCQQRRRSGARSACRSRGSTRPSCHRAHSFRAPLRVPGGGAKRQFRALLRPVVFVVPQVRHRQARMDPPRPRLQAPARVRKCDRAACCWLSLSGAAISCCPRTNSCHAVRIVGRDVASAFDPFGFQELRLDRRRHDGRDLVQQGERARRMLRSWRATWMCSAGSVSVSCRCTRTVIAVAEDPTLDTR
jgi:hypothetical protein